MEKPRICFVVSAPGTAEAFLKEPIRRLSSRFDIYLVANFNDGEPPEGFAIKGWKKIGIERRPNPPADLRALKQLYKYFKENHFDAVHSYTLKASLLTALAGYRARVPHRIRNFSGQLWCNMKGLKRVFYKSIEHIIVALDTDFMVDCNGQRQYLIEQGILKSPDQAIIPANGSVCGVDVEKFAFQQEKRLAIRKELGIIDETVVFIYLGRLRREKGIIELFSAFNELVRVRENTLLLLVGNEEEDIVSRISEYENLRLGQNVIYYGYTNDPALLLHSADVFVFPSYREGFGLSVLEASCVGLPVICSDTYGVIDAMVDDETGLRCRTRDSESLYQCMLTLFDNPDLRKALGQNGRRRVIRDFPREMVMQAWVEFYNNIFSDETI